MPQKIQIGDKWYVAATSASAEEQPQVLKNDQTFGMFDRFGDIQVLAPGKEGLYHNDTRFLSHQELLIDGARPLHLGSSVEESNSLLVIDLMNPDLPAKNGRDALAKGTLHVFRAKLLWQGSCHEHIRVTHHGTERISVNIEFTFDADFVDLFEVRGMKRERRGDRLQPEVAEHEVVLPYLGRDRRLRRTRIHFEPAPSAIDAGRATFELELDPGTEHHLYCTVACECDDDPPRTRISYEAALRDNNVARRAWLGGHCTVVTSNPLVNLWLDRSVSDLSMLTTMLPTGPYPYAGVPWYSTTFGRDGIITALEYLWVDPSLARGVLAYLAAEQATELDPQNDAEPGKILHEARHSEMALTREIPFGRYFGSVDSTPLFLVLAAAYYRRTGDLALIRSIWPNIRMALQWIDQWGDADGDGFVEYSRRSDEGLVQQGWKDSGDSIFHRDGRLAEAPIALCEVQGYVYQGKLAAGELARVMDEPELAQSLAQQAEQLRERFRDAFWCEEIGSYAIALDGNKEQCKVPSSNAGHTLWSGIAAPEHAQRITDALMGHAFFSGWGIRTIPAGAARYNPMSYHNGSIWPHDNALIAAGLKRYRFARATNRVATALFDAAVSADYLRLPELFCGFTRRSPHRPVSYPIACSPQAWAAGSPYLMLQAILGLSARAHENLLTINLPHLPTWLNTVEVRNLSVGASTVSMVFRREGEITSFSLLSRDGDVRVVMEE
jgi:glycogen debranching enzyme